MVVVLVSLLLVPVKPVAAPTSSASKTPSPPPPPAPTTGVSCGTGWAAGGHGQLGLPDAVLAADVALPRLLPGVTTPPDSALVAARMADATVRPD